MVQLIVGRKGKGKTKQLLDKVNTEIKDIDGNVVYLDKNTKHMFELNNRIRLINVSDYLITNRDEFIGFVSGIISQDHDLEQMYLDGFMDISHAEAKDVGNIFDKLEVISNKFNVGIVLSVSLDEHELPENWRSKVIVAL